MNSLRLLSIGIVVFGLTALANAAAPLGMSHDKTFFEKAAQSGKEEVAVSQAALPRLQNAQAKEFATMMVSDHSSTNRELKALAQKKGVPLMEKEPDTKTWAAGKDRDFDHEYMDKMVRDHQEAVELFTDASRKSDDPEVQAFAMKTLPTLQQHFDQAKAIKKALK